MNQREKDGCMALLGLMDSDDVHALAKTVCDNQVTALDKNDAIRIILSYSKSCVEFMKRRKIKRDLLFKYIVSVGIVVDPKAGKTKFAQQILAHWGTQNIDILDLMETGDDPPTQRLPLPDIQQTSPPGRQHLPLILQDSKIIVQNNYINVTPALNQPQQQSVLSGAQASAANSASLGPQPISQQTSGQVPQQSWLSDFLSFEKNVQSSPNDAEMGTEFCRWFYQMLNACNPNGPSAAANNVEFGPQHFFPDVVLKVKIGNSNELQEFVGAQATCEKLGSLVRDENCLFNVNLDSGVTIMATPHGLKMLIACGTVHKGSDVVGIFAQQFGLVRNPEQNFNWNIKYSNLKLHAGPVSQMPTLQSPGNIQAIQ